MRKKDGAARELHIQELAQFWNWLPAFRAVAEAGGINEAARVLRVSPSALSRSVGLLEAALGGPLFHRESGLVLTAHGERLLVAARDAMRLVHEAARPGAADSGSLRLGATGRIGFHRLLPAIHRIRHRYPAIDVQTVTVREGEIGALLLRGQLDLVVALRRTAPKGVESTSLPSAPSHVYCGKGHSLFSARSVPASAIEVHPFAVSAPVLEAGSPTDGWPSARPRRVGLVADTPSPRLMPRSAGICSCVSPTRLWPRWGSRRGSAR